MGTKRFHSCPLNLTIWEVFPITFLPDLKPCVFGVFLAHLCNLSIFSTQVGHLIEERDSLSKQLRSLGRTFEAESDRMKNEISRKKRELQEVQV